jgi:hypothetical protein
VNSVEEGLQAVTSRLTVSWDEYMAEKAPSVPSLWGDGLLVKGGGYLVIGGDTGVGKTILICNQIIACAAGWDSFLGMPLPGRQVPSLILEAEGNRFNFRDRIAAIARNMGVQQPLPIHFHARDTELAIGGPNLETMIDQTGAEHVFMDPIGRFWTGNENDATEWRAGVTLPLARLAGTLDVAFSFGDHYGKPNENRTGQHKLRGSAAKLQDCGAAMRLEIGRAGGRSRILYFDRVRDGALPFPDRDPSRMPLLIDVASGTVALDDREDADRGSSREPRHADVRRILAGIAGDGGKASTKVLRDHTMAELDLEKSRATDLISSAARAGVIERARRGYYCLPGSLLEVAK